MDKNFTIILEELDVLEDRRTIDEEISVKSNQSSKRDLDDSSEKSDKAISEKTPPTSHN